MECDAMYIGGVDGKGYDNYEKCTIEEVQVGTVWNVGGAEEIIQNLNGGVYHVDIGEKEKIETKDVVWSLEDMGEEVEKG